MRKKGRKSRRAVMFCRPMAACKEERWRKRPPPLFFLSLPPSLSSYVTRSFSPFGFNQADSWFEGGLSSAGINLCDRGLLDGSDHPCWLTEWREPAVKESERLG